MNIKILVADDHKIMREGLRALLDKQSDMQVVAEAEDGLTTVRMTRELAPDVVIMDIAMPDLNGIGATKKIKAESPDVKVIALSMHSDRRFIAEMFRSGASGYLLKDHSFEELSNAIRVVVSNRIYLSPSIAGIVIEDYVRQLQKDDVSPVTDVLTDREVEVLQQIAEGHPTKEIALRLHVSVKTIETHRRQIMEKLNLFSVAELTKYAIRQGLTTVEGYKGKDFFR
ncbi:MAG TPA: response regulator transcription factor [Syntrophales bacterium]|jgi:DNA-binding NarL/FixJ family response regulator|nr:response regulator transcription factor [Syntrophales bacterium]HPX57133.1 response regulator transcription factor [Syntrophales bacterium]HQA83687.1 response regulator transcription factor [Syntrophales bacterium]